MRQIVDGTAVEGLHLRRMHVVEQGCSGISHYGLKPLAEEYHKDKRDLKQKISKAGKLGWWKGGHVDSCCEGVRASTVRVSPGLGLLFLLGGDGKGQKPLDLTLNKG